MEGIKTLISWLLAANQGGNQVSDNGTAQASDDIVTLPRDARFSAIAVRPL